jgi:hypothetical protein
VASPASGLWRLPSDRAPALHRMVRGRAGGSSIGPCSTGSAPPARSTGRGRSSTGRVCAPKRGLADRPKPGRSRQAGLEDPRPVRPRRTASRARCLGRESARLASVRAAHPGHPEGPLPTRPMTSPTATGHCARGASATASPAAASSPRPGSADTGGSSSAPSPGSAATAA